MTGRRLQSLLRIAAFLAGLAAMTPGRAEAPARVMSLNVCTDQLAMLLAAPGQLVSVSALADDPALSYHTDMAAGFPKNRGLAEEVLIERPDLVVTGTYSLHNTTALLRRLGFRVVEFDYAQTMETIPATIRKMGDALGRAPEADVLASDFESRLARISGPSSAQCAPAPTAIAYGQNGVTSGTGTLIDSAMRAAGLRNLAAELGYDGMAPIPLELIIQNRPQILVVPQPIAATPALADLAASHPALRQLGEEVVVVTLPRASASCDGPFILEAIEALAAARRTATGCAGADGRQ